MKKLNTTGVIIGSIILLTLTLLAILFLFVLEPYDRVVHRDPSPEVRRNPYEALERWLNHQDIPYTRLQRPADLPFVPEENAVYLTAAAWFKHSTFPRWSLLDHIAEEGGRWIIYSIREEEGDNTEWQPFWKELPLIIHTEYEEEPTHREQYKWIIPEEEEGGRLVDMEGILPFSPSPETPPVHHVLIQEKTPGTDERQQGSALLTLPWGAGEITLCTEPLFLLNKNLGRDSNAALSWQLLGSPGGSFAAVYHLHSSHTEIGEKPFWQTSHFLWQVLVPLLILTLLWISRQRVTFGPLLEEPPSPCDDFQRRFAAEGRFWWHREGKKQMKPRDYLRKVQKKQETNQRKNSWKNRSVNR